MNIKQIAERIAQIIIPRNDIRLCKSYTIEVPLTNLTQGGQNKFQLNEILQPKGTGSVIFTGLQVYDTTQQTLSDTGRPIVNNVDAAKLSIVFKWQNVEKVFQEPYNSFNTNLNFGMIRKLANQQYSLTDSYIQVMEGGIAAGKSALVTFYYK